MKNQETQNTINQLKVRKKLPPIITKKFSNLGTEGTLDSCTQKTPLSGISPYQNTYQNEENQLLMDGKLGAGAYGQVFRALHKKTGKFFAIKEICVHYSSTNLAAKLEMLQQEVDILKNLSHPNIVEFRGCSRRTSENFEKIRIYMEYLPGGSLSSMLKQYGAFPEHLVRKFSFQILKGLHYLHSHGVIHRDLKCGNILVSNKATVKIGDFGASKAVGSEAFQEMCNSVKGSLYWMAPEVVKGEGYTWSADIWSLGCIVVEMSSGLHPWSQVASFWELIGRMTEDEQPSIPNHLSQECKDFVSLCFSYEKNKRPAAAQLLKHSWISEY